MRFIKNKIANRQSEIENVRDGFEMRKGKEEVTKNVTHWYCEKCKRLLHTKLYFVRHRCGMPGCGRFMKTITESELAELREELLQEQLMRVAEHNTHKRNQPG